MPLSLTEDIRSVTNLKRHTREILDHVHQTGRSGSRCRHHQAGP